MQGAHTLKSPHPEQGRALYGAMQGGHALMSPHLEQGGSLQGEVNEELRGGVQQEVQSEENHQDQDH